MTEIPEHLLKRSRDRRAALGVGEDEGAAAQTAPATTPATTAPAVPDAPSGPPQRGALPAEAAPPPPKPDSPVVAAYKRRKRVPFWAMMGLATLPVWAMLYARSITSQPEEASGPLSVGAETYSSAGCSGCHGATGGGGVGYAFTNGDSFATFPLIEDQLRWVMYGTAAYNLADVEIYGNPDREGGARITGERGNMPQQVGVLSDAEILAAVCHERYTLGGVTPDDQLEEFELWCSDEAPTWIDLEEGGDLATLFERVEGTRPIGDVPVPGSPG